MIFRIHLTCVVKLALIFVIFCYLVHHRFRVHVLKALFLKQFTRESYMFKCKKGIVASVHANKVLYTNMQYFAGNI